MSEAHDLDAVVWYLMNGDDEIIEASREIMDCVEERKKCDDETTRITDTI